MNGLIFDIKRFAVHDGPGIRTTVFFKACPLRCQWCHNPESISPEPQTVIKKITMDNILFEEQETVGERMTTDEVMDVLLKEKIFMESSGGGVTFSGGEPLMQAAFLKSLLIACKKENIHTAVDTCGYAKQSVLQDIIPYTDLFLYDLKLMDDKKHRFYTGVSNNLILENLIYLLDNKHPVRVRIPVIPDVNFNQENTDAILHFLHIHPGNVQGVDLLPYHNIARTKYIRFEKENRMKDKPALSSADLVQMSDLFIKAGFETKIGG